MRKSVKTRLVIVALLLMGAGTLLMVLISVGITASSARSAAYDRGQEIARRYAHQFDAALAVYKTTAGTLAASMPHLADRREVLVLLRTLLEQNPQFLGAYVGYEPGAFDGLDARFANAPGHDSTGRFIPYYNRLTGSITLDPLLDYDTSDYYFVPKNTKKPAVLEPFTNEGVLVTSFVFPILSGEERFIGIAGVDVALDELDALASQIKVYDSGYAFVVSRGGVFISYPDKTRIGKSSLDDLSCEHGAPVFDELATAIAEGHSGYIETQDPISGQQAVLFYEPVTTTGWGMVVVIPVREMMAGTNRLIVVLVVVGLVGLVLAGGLFWMIVSRTVQPLTSLRDAIRLIASGELDVSIHHPAQDEIGQIAQAFNHLMMYLQRMASSATAIAQGNLSLRVSPQSERDALGNAFHQMQNRLHALITGVAEQTMRLNISASQLASGAEQTGRATSQISTTIQEMAKGITQSTESITRTALSVEQMSRAIDAVVEGSQAQAAAVNKASEIASQFASSFQRVSDNAGFVTSESSRAAEVAQAGSERVRETIVEMENIQKTVLASAEKVSEMGARSDQIANIAEMIDEIAAQTNLLALNAAIEAARAGQYGKGFAVVADEVRRLADRSSAATREINNLIDSIQNTVAEAVSAMDAGSRQVEVGVARAHEAGNMLQNILEAVQKVGQRAQGTLSAAQVMKSLSSELVDAVDTVSSVVEENTAAAEQMTAASSEVSRSIENIASIAEQNSAAAEQVSAATEQLNAQAVQLAASIQELQKMSQTLSQAISKFELDADQVLEAD